MLQPTMQLPARPHVLGIDDGPFEKSQAEPVPIVGVMMEGADLVESVAVSSFPVDGDGATGFLDGWVTSLRLRDSLHAVVLGGVTLAGLGLVDLSALAERLGVPVLAVTRRDSGASDLEAALRAAGLGDRVALLRRSPRAVCVDEGVWVAAAGTDFESASALLRATTGKSRLPEPLRLAHLFAAALARGESRGRV